ncbi:hypothetical protein BDW71DRAFT_176897 [Aspergillus fruticulosus]
MSLCSQTWPRSYSLIERRAQQWLLRGRPATTTATIPPSALNHIRKGASKPKYCKPNNGTLPIQESFWVIAIIIGIIYNSACRNA